MVIFLSGFVAALVELAHHRGPGRALSGLVSGLSLAFLAGLVIVMLPLVVDHNVWSFSLEPSLALGLVLGIPVLAALLALGLLVQTVRAWRAGRYSLATRVHNSLVLLGFAGFTYFLLVRNLFGWRF